MNEKLFFVSDDCTTLLAAYYWLYTGPGNFLEPIGPTSHGKLRAIIHMQIA